MTGVKRNTSRVCRVVNFTAITEPLLTSGMLYMASQVIKADVLRQRYTRSALHKHTHTLTLAHGEFYS